MGRPCSSAPYARGEIIHLIPNTPCFKGWKWVDFPKKRFEKIIQPEAYPNQKNGFEFQGAFPPFPGFPRFVQSHPKKILRSKKPDRSCRLVPHGPNHAVVTPTWTLRYPWESTRDNTPTYTTYIWTIWWLAKGNIWDNIWGTTATVGFPRVP